jgi:beta-N-acetylhexosaminidase
LLVVAPSNKQQATSNEIMASKILGIGIVGTTLSDLERRILIEHPPYAVVLFSRNILDVVQTRELINEIRNVARRSPLKRAPLFMIDQEGGRVDRLRHLIPGLPPAEAFAEGEHGEELAEWSGRLIGMAQRYFDIECNLAPVVDIRGAVAPPGLQRRTFGDSPEVVTSLAGAFMRGLHATGTAACLKHFPGIGLSSGDSHYGAINVTLTADELRARDLVPFTRLGAEAGAILIGHGTYPHLDPELPATLSPRIATGLLREEAGFEGFAISDDMEMHAVSDLGSYPAICERALMAGNDLILLCSDIESVPEVQAYLERRAEEDPRVRARRDEALARADRYRNHCNALRASAGPPPRHFDDILEEAIRFAAVFQQTRNVTAPEAAPETKEEAKRTGREEWT